MFRLLRPCLDDCAIGLGLTFLVSSIGQADGILAATHLAKELSEMLEQCTVAVVDFKSSS
jgi:hypothetical protein